MGEPAGPFVTIATFCRDADQRKQTLEGILHEKRFSPGKPVRLAAVVAVNCGDAVGTHSVRWSFIAPSGREIGGVLKERVEFPRVGFCVVIYDRLSFQDAEVGMYWLDVFVDERRLSRASIRLVEEVLH